MIVAHRSRQKSVTVAHSSRQNSHLDVGIESKVRNSDLTGQIPMHCWNGRSPDACVRARACLVVLYCRPADLKLPLAVLIVLVLSCH